MANLAVYNSGPGRWFGQDYRAETTERIETYLADRGFEKLRTPISVREWMEDTLTEETNKTALVFAVDEVPNSICRVDSPNVLIREYLDAGGRIVWMGDIPFWSVWKPAIDPPEVATSISTKGLSVEKWDIGLPQQILGVFPLIAESSGKVEFHGKGTELLNNRWYGERPIIVKIESGEEVYLFEDHQLFEGINILASSSVMLSESGWNTSILQRVMEESEIAVSKSGGLDFQFLRGKVGETTVKTALSLLQDRYLIGEYANAWQLVFNSNYENQGFYRLWDSQFGEMTDEMLEDLFMVATNGLEIS